MSLDDIVSQIQLGRFDFNVQAFYNGAVEDEFPIVKKVLHYADLKKARNQNISNTILLGIIAILLFLLDPWSMLGLIAAMTFLGFLACAVLATAKIRAIEQGLQEFVADHFKLQCSSFYVFLGINPERAVAMNAAEQNLIGKVQEDIGRGLLPTEGKGDPALPPAPSELFHAFLWKFRLVSDNAYTYLEKAQAAREYFAAGRR